MSYIINLFEIGIRYWICDLPEPIFEEMLRLQTKHKVHWEQLLFDFDLLKHFGYNHWCQLSQQTEKTGFLLEPQNRIEIKQGSKFIARFKADQLTNSSTLFPLYQITETKWLPDTKEGCKTFILTQHEKGLIGKFKFEADEFKIEYLNFNIKNLESFSFLSEFEYQNQKLKKISDDVLTISNSAILIQTN
jgi:hypothetical protein